ncbi:hypothetical protein ACHAQH_008440 [Verticillium albo-atrum]
MSVLVLGAGELGSAVLQALADHHLRKSSPIVVLLRPATILSSNPSLDIDIVPGDNVADSVAALAATFSRYHTVISCTGFALPPGTQLKITEVILQASVPRYLPWQLGVDYDVIGAGSAQDILDEQLRVRERLRGQTEVDWLINSTGLFISFLFEPALGVVNLESRTVRALGSWDTKITLTAADDIATMVAEVTFDPRELKSQAVFIAGDTSTYEHAAELIEKRVGASFTREEWTMQHLQAELE